MSAPAAAAADAPKPKGKKLIVFGGLAVLLLAIAAAAWMMLGRGDADEDGADGPAPAAHAKKKDGAPPTYLPLENMVVNLADAGGEKFAQVGVTVEVLDQKTADQVKNHMPTIRSAVLMLISQRSSEELLTREGKEKLATDILREISQPLGYEVEEEEPPAQDGKSRRRPRQAAFNPVHKVLFSSFIIQ